MNPLCVCVCVCDGPILFSYVVWVFFTLKW
jgi:hypothetical protein